jgi:single-strand DNA-binding protein
MSTDPKITVAGWVGTQPKHFVSESGSSFTSFRMGCTKRFFDRTRDQWVDGTTTWFTVKTWRSAAVNVAESLRKSDPVVVHGSLTTQTWESPEGPRTTLVIEADALGPDLTRGQATFRHTVHTRAAKGDGSAAGGDAAGGDLAGGDAAGGDLAGESAGDTSNRELRGEGSDNDCLHDASDLDASSDEGESSSVNGATQFEVPVAG